MFYHRLLSWCCKIVESEKDEIFVCDQCERFFVCKPNKIQHQLQQDKFIVFYLYQRCLDTVELLGDITEILIAYLRDEVNGMNMEGVHCESGC